MFNLGSKIKVTFTLKSGQQVSMICKHFKIDKKLNDLVGYTAEGLDKSQEDPMFYLRLDEVAHISYKRVWW